MYLPYDFCAFDMLLRNLPNSVPYLVEKVYWLLHARNCRNQAGRSVVDLIDTSLSEDIELWNQLCRL